MRSKLPVVPAAALAAALLVAGCSQPTDVTGSAGGPATSTDAPRPRPTADVPPDLRAVLPACPASSDLPAVEGGLPAVTLACLGPGEPVLLSGLRGRPLILNAWASWCQPCRTELPALASFSQLNGAEVAVLGLDVADDPAAAAALWSELGIPFGSVIDPDATTRAGLSWIGLPVTYFVDAGGAIVARHPGAIDTVEQWQALAAEHLGVP